MDEEVEGGSGEVSLQKSGGSAWLGTERMDYYFKDDEYVTDG